MAPRYVSIDRNTPLLLPPDLRDWLPEDHLAHFVVEALDALAMEGARVNERGRGDAQYPPRMMLSLLCYAYATGVFSSRQIERSTYTDVAMRYLSGDTHPDHDTLCTFRRRNGALLEQALVGVLRLAQEMRFLKVGRIAVDGTKVAANASKHSALRYGRAGEKLEPLEMEVAQLLRKAEEADRTPLEDNAQAAVDTDSRLIVGQRVCNAPNDKEQLAPTVKAVPREVGGTLREVLADSGFASEAAIREVERDGGPTVPAAVEQRAAA